MLLDMLPQQIKGIQIYGGVNPPMTSEKNDAGMLQWIHVKALRLVNFNRPFSFRENISNLFSLFRIDLLFDVF